jgi:hypothetical protein
MPNYTFHTPINDVATLLTVQHVAGDGELVVSNVSLFGSPSVSAPVRVTATDGTNLFICSITGITGSTLQIGGFLEDTSDVTLDIGSTVEIRMTAGDMLDVQEAINAGMMLIGNQVSDGTPNRVLYVDTSGNLNQSGGLTYDQSTGILTATSFVGDVDSITGTITQSQVTDLDDALASKLGVSDSISSDQLPVSGVGAGSYTLPVVTFNDKGVATSATAAVAGTDYSSPVSNDTVTGLKKFQSPIHIDRGVGTFADGVMIRVTTDDTTLTPDFIFQVNGYDQEGVPPEDHVFSIGWKKPGSVMASSTIDFESSYPQYAEVRQFETHFAQMILNDGSGKVIRPFSAIVVQDGTFCAVSTQSDEVSFQNSSGVQQISIHWPGISILGNNVITHSTNNIQWLTQVNNVGSAISLAFVDASNIIHIGDSGHAGAKIALDNTVTQLVMANNSGKIFGKNGAGTTSVSMIFLADDDIIHIGDISYSASTLKFDNDIYSLIFKNAGDGIVWKNSTGTATPFLYVNSGNNTLLDPPGSFYHTTPASRFTQFRANTGNPYWRFDNGVGFTVGGSVVNADGTHKMGFWGHSPVVQPSGELIAGLVGTGLFSSITSAVVPTVSGSSSSAGNLQLQSTTHATKGKIKFGATDYYDEATRTMNVAFFVGDGSGLTGISGGSADAVLTTGSYADPTWLTSLAGSKVTNLTTDLAAKAPLASPTFTGTVTGTFSGSGAALTSLTAANISAGTAAISISGNAATATNGVVTTGSYADPSWLTSLAGSKVTGNIGGNAASISGSITESQVTNLTTDLAAKALLASSVVSKTSAYTVTSSDDMVVANATGGAFTVTLPNATTVGDGREFTVKKIDSSSNAVTIGTTSSQTIDGATTKVLTAQWTSITVKALSGAWYIK